jgi:hypothetical protein
MSMSGSMRCLLLFLITVASLRADWLIEQRNPRDRSTTRWVIGKSALKITWRDRDSSTDFIVDFAAALVTKVNHEEKTIASIAFDAYLREKAAEPPPEEYVLEEPSMIAGLKCACYSYRHPTAANSPGGWRGGAGCFTREIAMPAPHDLKFTQFIDALEGRRGRLGFTLAFQASDGGPSVVTLETTRASKKPAADSEFQPPAAYKKVEFTSP